MLCVVWLLLRVLHANKPAAGLGQRPKPGGVGRAVCVVWLLLRVLRLPV